MTDSAASIAADIAVNIEMRLESLRLPELAGPLRDWPLAPVPRSVRAGSAATLPVLSWLPQIGRDAGTWAAEIVSAVCGSAAALAWQQTYRESEIGRSFLDNYAYTEIMGTRGPLASEHIACGFLLLGPATRYPRHRHEAEELYVPLSGTASWQRGDSQWRDHAPGTPIHHASEEPHAMRTGPAPLLALYVWWNADLDESARLG